MSKFVPRVQEETVGFPYFQSNTKASKSKQARMDLNCIKISITFLNIEKICGLKESH